MQFRLVETHRKDEGGKRRQVLGKRNEREKTVKRRTQTTGEVIIIATGNETHRKLIAFVFRNNLVLMNTCQILCPGTSLLCRTYLSIGKPICLCACMSVTVLACLSLLPPVCLCSCLSVYLPACLSLRLTVSVPAYLTLCLPACLSLRMTVSVPAYLSLCLSACICTCLSVSLPLFLLLIRSVSQPVSQ